MAVPARATRSWRRWSWGTRCPRLADAAWFERWLSTASPEALILAYADKRAGQRLESMAARFGSWERRYPPEARAGRTRGAWTPEILVAVWRRAETIELMACELAGVTPDEVRRLPWTGPCASIGEGRLKWLRDPPRRSATTGATIRTASATARTLWPLGWRATGPPLERMRLTGAATTADEITERVATATLFGGGTLVVVAEPAPLIATKPLAARLVEALGAVADRKRPGVPGRRGRHGSPPRVPGGPAQRGGSGRRRRARVQGPDARPDGALDRGPRSRTRDRHLPARRGHARRARRAPMFVSAT